MDEERRAKQLQGAAERFAHAIDQRNRWMKGMRTGGATYAAIAAAADMSVSGVHTLLRRQRSGPARGNQGSAEDETRRWARRARQAAERRDELLDALIADFEATHSDEHIANIAGVAEMTITYRRAHPHRRRIVSPNRP